LSEPTSHARSAWWLGTEAYAPIALKSAQPRSRWSRGQTPKFSFNFLRLPPSPPAAGEKEREENFGFTAPLQNFKKSIFMITKWITLFSVPRGALGRFQFGLR